MNVAILFIDTEVDRTYYSSFIQEDCPHNVKVLLNDFDALLPEGECVAITVCAWGEVVLIERVTQNDWNEFGEPCPSYPLCYNVMKAYCDAYGIKMILPEYIGPYSLEIAKENCDKLVGDFAIIPCHPEFENCEVIDES